MSEYPYGGLEDSSQNIRSSQKFVIFVRSITRTFRGKCRKREVTDQMDEGHFYPTDLLIPGNPKPHYPVNFSRDFIATFQNA
jgi:hypothetical protein